MKLLKNSYYHVTAPASYRKGLALYRQKKWQEALEVFQNAYHTAPQHAQNTFKLGLCHLKLGNPQEAHFYLNQAIGLAPYNK